jgi:hypothetical protein
VPLVRSTPHPYVADEAMDEIRRQLQALFNPWRT